MRKQAPAFLLSCLLLASCAPAQVSDGPYGPGHKPSVATYERAEKGDAAALEEVGMAFCNKGAETTKADASRALVSLERAAKEGRAGAAVFIAQMYDTKDTCNMTPDNREILRWNTEAAKLGSGYAAQQLGIMYSVGYGHANDGYNDQKHRMPKNLVQSYFWYKVSAANDYASVFKDYAKTKEYQDARAAEARSKISAAQAAAMDKKAEAFVKKYPQHAY